MSKFSYNGKALRSPYARRLRRELDEFKAELSFLKAKRTEFWIMYQKTGYALLKDITEYIDNSIQNAVWEYNTKKEIYRKLKEPGFGLEKLR